MRGTFFAMAVLAGAMATGLANSARAQVPEKAEGALRIASFNANLVRKGAGVLIKDIAKGDPQIANVAEIILRVDPDILLINELDHDPEGRALSAFAEVLGKGRDGAPGPAYAVTFAAPVNTGVPSGLDLDGDGRTMGPGDALGFGRFPGQYGMALLVKEPLFLAGPPRTYQTFKWANVPWAKPPKNPDGSPFYTDKAWTALPLSSKSHWDVPVQKPNGRLIHVLASHPTPPVFDGPENRNGLRNAAEIRFWRDYIDGKDWMLDDAGQRGGLVPEAAFVVVGDLNADPEKGDGDRKTVKSLLDHPRVQDPKPASPGAKALGAATDTADWPEKDGPGNLRVDYVLPSVNLLVTASGVFWPEADDPLHKLVAIKGRKRASSDHRLVWVDVEFPDR